MIFECFEDGAVVDLETLIENGIIRKENDGLKVLGNGEITKKLTVKAKVFSATAKEKIEAAGGKTEVIWSEKGINDARKCLERSWSA